ncbi:MAG: hypothetical protein ACNI22_04615 [Halarcobacter sp.]
MNEVNKSKAKKLHEFDRTIEAFIKEEFSPIETKSLHKEKANTISETLIENFFKQIEEPLRGF